MTTEIVHAAPLAQELPEMLVVGIGYPVKFYPEMIPFREHDFTPTKVSDVENSGGANNFLKFIQTELMPVINKTYRTNMDDQTNMGYSLGALFAFYSLFHQPELFNRYVILSPAIAWDEKVTMKYETQSAAKNKKLPAKIFMSVGSLESGDMIENMHEIAQVMEARGYEGLELSAHVFEDETHISVVPTAINKGLRAVFP